MLCCSLVMFRNFFSGFVLLSTLTSFFLFWLFHIIHVFSSFAFPFKSEYWFQSKALRRQTYTVEMVFILLCGFLPGIIIASTSGYRFLGFPLLCVVSSESILFYTFLLPLTLGSTIGLSLLLASFWITHKVNTKYRCMFMWCGVVRWGVCMNWMSSACSVVCVMYFYVCSIYDACLCVCMCMQDDSQVVGGNWRVSSHRLGHFCIVSVSLT